MARSNTPTRISSKRRWIVGAIAAGLLLIFGLAAAVPWLVQLPGVRQRVTWEASRMLAPGSLELSGLRVSWTGSTKLEGMRLIDAEHRPVIAAEEATLSWSLWDLLVARPTVATLTLDRARLEIVRSRDGRVNLLETLGPVLSDRPSRSLHVRIPNGRLEFHDDLLSDPIVSDRSEIELNLDAYPLPISWRMRLERDLEKESTGTVVLTGTLQRDRADGIHQDLGLRIEGNQWPWRHADARLEANGRFEGTIEIQQTRGEWRLETDTRLLEVEASGGSLSEDRLRLPCVQAALKVEGRNDQWLVDRLALSSELGSMSVTGVVPPVPEQPARIVGDLDLAALATQLPRTLRLNRDLRPERGRIEFTAEVAADPELGGDSIRATARVSDLSARSGDRSLAFRAPADLVASLKRRNTSIELTQLEVKTPFLEATGRGDLERGIAVSATIDLDAAVEQLDDWLDLGQLRPGGRARLQADYRRIGDRFAASAGAELTALRLDGLPLVESLASDQLSVTINAEGATKANGFPASLGALELAARSADSELGLAANFPDHPEPIAIRGQARTVFALNGGRKTAETHLRAFWNAETVDLDQLTMTVAPVVGPGGQFLPGQPMEWTGTGRYDRARDVLTIHGSVPPDNGSAPLPIAPQRVRIGGLQQGRSPWVDADLVGGGSDVDLALLGLPHRISGAFRASLQVRNEAETWELGTRIQLRDLGRLGDDGSTTPLISEAVFIGRGSSSNLRNRITIDELAAVFPGARLEGAGVVLDLATKPRFELSGALMPDWEFLSETLARQVEPNASVEGSPRPWSVSGELPGSGGNDWTTTLTGNLGIELNRLDVFGMRLGPTSVVLRAENGRLQIDPIDSTLNGGRLHLQPEILRDETGDTWLGLAAGSFLTDAAVNDEVSHRVLSYAAPVLDQATRVNGRVSLELTDARFPLLASEEAQAMVDGDLHFDDVEFMPGPLADQILGVFRQERRPLLRLGDSVSFRILGRRIYQEGLVVPLGNVAAIGVEGWSDFDQNLNMTASFAMLPPRRDIPVVSQLLANTQLQVPITGTFQNPRIDGEAIKERFKQLGTSVLDNLMGLGANGLQQLLRIPGPGRPPPDLFPPFPGVERARRPPDPARELTPTPNEPPAATRDDNLRPSNLKTTPPADRRLLREQRRLRRLEKRAERSLRRESPHR